MPKKLFFVDFDRTLFDNRSFFQDICTILATEFDVDGQHLRDFAHQHEIIRSKATGIFDLFEIIREIRPDISIQKVKDVAKSDLLGRAYTFADVRQFVDHVTRQGHKFRIITVGTDEYQRFKFEFTPELSIFEFKVTQKQKGVCLEGMKGDFEGYDQVVLVDDRADTFDESFMKLNIRGIRLLRVDSQYAHIPTPQGIEEVNHLLEIDI